MLCEVMNVCRSGFYDWQLRKPKPIDMTEYRLARQARELFQASRGSLGSRQLMAKLREEGFVVGRYKVRNLMKRLGLKVYERQAYKITTLRKHSHAVANNVLNQDFDVSAANKVWAGDVTYLKTREGWVYLAIVMDLYSRRIIGFATSKRMKTTLVLEAMKMAVRNRQPSAGFIFHSDRGSQYTAKAFRRYLNSVGAVASMSGKGACWDNAVVERFFGSLKHEWLANVVHLTREGMANDVQQYMKYYNYDRLHTSNGNMSPVKFEFSQMKVSVAA